MIIGGVSGLVGSKLSPNKSTSTTTQNRDPSQEALHAQLAEIFKNMLTTGPNIPAWQKNQAAGQINTSYAGALPKLEQQLASRGFENSGKFGATARGLEIGRINALSQSQNQLAQGAQARYDQNVRDAQQFTQQGAGSTTVQTGPSNLGSTIAGVGGDLSTMLLLRNLFASAGGGGGGGGGNLGGGAWDVLKGLGG